MLYSYIYNTVKNNIEGNKLNNNLVQVDNKKVSRKKLNELLDRFIVQYRWDKDEICLHCYGYIRYYVDSESKYNIFELFDLIQKTSLEKINIDNNLLVFNKERKKHLYDSARFLENKGFKIELNEGNISRKSIDDIFIYIESLIKRIGSHFIKRLLIEIEDYKKNYGLYHIPIHTEFNSHTQIPPYGVLLALGFKHYNRNSLQPIDFENHYRLIIELSIHLTNLLDLYFSGQHFDLMFSDGENIIQETQRLVLLDSIYRFNQYKSDHVLYFLKKTLDKIFSECIESNIKRKINIVFDIFNFVHKQKESCFEIFSFIKMFENYNHQDVFDTILDISHINNCNINYVNIYDFDKLNYYDKPFILNYSEVSGSVNIIYPNDVLFSIGFYNCIMNLLRTKCNIDSKTGEWLEIIVSEELRKIGLNIIGPNKKYILDKNQKKQLKIDSDSLETDLIIDFDDRICFMEIKKKTLKKESKSGEYFSILDDLMKSLLKSQIQAYRHERFLRTYEKICFTDDTSIELKDREIITISLSNFNYGSLHDFSFTSKILDILGKGYLKDEHKDGKKINEFNKSLKQLHKEIELKKYEYENMKFSKCHFLNIFHLFF